jgi:hypothetical protein
MHRANRLKSTWWVLLTFASFSLTTMPSAQAQANMLEAEAIAAYPLTMDHVARQFKVAADLYKDPQLKNQYTEVNELSLEDRIQKVESLPKLASVAKAHGITVRDLIMTSAALGPAIAVAGLMDTGERGPGTSPENKVFWAAAPPEHIKFYRDHKAEVDKLVAEMMQNLREGTKEAGGSGS